MERALGSAAVDIGADAVLLEHLVDGSETARVRLPFRVERVGSGGRSSAAPPPEASIRTMTFTGEALRFLDSTCRG
jgi:hypothetical protein